MRETFRLLIIASTAIYIAWFFFPFYGWYFLSEDTLDLLSWHGFGAQVTLPLFAIYAIFAISVLSAIGMYFFIPIARSVFVWLYILLTVLSFFQGVVVQSSIESALFSLVLLMDGAIIAIAYLTSVERLFAVGEGPDSSR